VYLLDKDALCNDKHTLLKMHFPSSLYPDVVTTAKPSQE
jgi:hypothetical protein